MPLAMQAIQTAHNRASIDKMSQSESERLLNNVVKSKEDKTLNQIRIDAEKKAENEKLNYSTKNGTIPCLYMPYLGGSSKLMIYFHGNAEDVGLAMELLSFIKDMMKVRQTQLLTTIRFRFMFLLWSTQAMACTKESLILTRSVWMLKMSMIT